MAQIKSLYMHTKIFLQSAVIIFTKCSISTKISQQQKYWSKKPDIARDIVAYFYGIKNTSHNYPEWRYILEVFKIRQFFCLDNDVSILYDLSVPSEGFDLFLEIVSQFDIATDRKLLTSIKRNLPEKYDLGKLSNSFIELLQKTLP